MRFNLKIIVSFLGLLLIMNGTAMLLCLPVSFYYNDGAWPAILTSGLTTLAIGLVARLLTRKSNEKDIQKRDGYLIVTLGWFYLAITGAMPYVLSDSIPIYADAFFETMSGYTTTGATILTDIEAVAPSILFWRSLTHWIGGMGIIVLTIAILPLLGIGGMQLFVAESPGVSPEKLHPRITETAKRLWIVYVLLTAAETVLLTFGGMTLFDAVNHSMSTLATGGFSTKNASIAHYDSPFIHYVISLFMFLAGVNFTLNYFLVKGQPARLWKNEEFRLYAFFCVLLTVITAVTILYFTPAGIEKAFRDGLFQVLSIVTTTGFITADYTTWAPFTTVLFFILFFTGACTGSTSGGIKMMRHLVLGKNSLLEFKRLLHPSAVIPVRFNGKAVSQSITYNVSAFVLLYLFVFFTGSLIMSSMGLDFMTAMGSVTATLGNIGPAIGNVGPVDNFAAIPLAGKWFLSFLMLLGRLELFTVMILLTPFFWSRY